MNSIKKTARIAGFLYWLMAVFVIIGLSVPALLIVPGNTAATVNNLTASDGQFRAGIACWLIGQTVFIMLVLAFYKLFKPVNKNYAVLMVIFVLVGVPIAMLNELNHFAAVLLLSGADYLTTFTADQLHAQVMLFLDLYEQGIDIVSIFWGLWLFPLGYLVYKSGYFPRILGVFLMIGCLGYVLDSLLIVLFPNYEALITLITTIPEKYAELPFMLWLLFKGANVEQPDNRVLESA